MNNLNVSLYLVTDSTYHTEESFLRTVEDACKGGVTLVQLREKNTGGRDYLEKACKVREITDRYQIPLIIDDRVDVAMACGAAGVHVGASDLPVAEVRRLLGPDKIVGATAKNRGGCQESIPGRCRLPWGWSYLPDNHQGYYRTDRSFHIVCYLQSRTDSGCCHWRSESFQSGYLKGKRRRRHCSGICNHESRKSEKSSRRTANGSKTTVMQSQIFLFI